MSMLGKKQTEYQKKISREVNLKNTHTLGKNWKWSKSKEERKQSSEHIEKCRQSKIGKARPDMIGNTHGFKKEI